ncbi:hypothetical protein H9L39_07018 [Fusarium oxysporum f. sp. albedinis]|nr:hypothetical protein H9L39_07018 [Fusarium oxysporum f. sp. albedinis]
MEKISQHAGHVIAVNLLIKHASHISLLRVSGLEPSLVFLQSILALLHKFASEQGSDVPLWVHSHLYLRFGPHLDGYVQIFFDLDLPTCRHQVTKH